jgi:hypothetical protein
MHPATLDCYHAAKMRGRTSRDWPVKIMEGPHHFEVSPGIVDAAEAIAKNERSRMEAGDPMHFPAGSRLPCDEMVFVTNADRETNVYLLWQAKDSVMVAWACPHCIVPIGSWTPGTAKGGLFAAAELSHPVARAARQSLPDWLAEQGIWVLAITLSLMNEPRLVTRSTVEHPRTSRRRIERLTGKPALAYTKVTWQVGAGVKAKRDGSDEDGGLRMPLHWCRAHWRKAEEDWAGATWVEPRMGAPKGWYIWVTDCWKGHPDHGIKLQDHAPRMIGERAVGTAQEQSVPSAAKWAAMSAQQRAMMAQAGFAPSAAVH